MGGSDDPWARKFIENNGAGFGPYALQQLLRGQQAVFKARADYYGGKPAIDTVIFKEVPTSASRVQLAARAGRSTSPSTCSRWRS